MKSVHLVLVFVLFLGVTFAALKFFEGKKESPVPVPPLVVVPPQVVEPEKPKEELVVAPPKTFDEAVVAAKKTGKKVMLMLSGSECPPCKDMKRTTLVHPDIVKILNEKFFLIISDDDRVLARRFRILGYPTYFIVDGDGKVLKSERGRKSVEEFKKFLEG